MALGSEAREKPQFDFRDTTSDPQLFAATAQALEDTGVGAYNGQGSNLRRRALPPAASIVSVEARHAAWIRRINAGPSYPERPDSFPAPVSFDRLLTQEQVEEIVADTNFIQG